MVRCLTRQARIAAVLIAAVAGLAATAARAEDIIKFGAPLPLDRKSVV